LSELRECKQVELKINEEMLNSPLYVTELPSFNFRMMLTTFSQVLGLNTWWSRVDPWQGVTWQTDQ
jgi:hypothetical protein